MSKTLVQLACHPVCIKPLVSHPLFVEIWTKFAQHAFGEIRQRAAVVFNQIVSNGLGCVLERKKSSYSGGQARTDAHPPSRWLFAPRSQDARFKPTVAILANEVLNGEFEKPPENAKISEAVMLAKMFARTNSTASQETAPRMCMMCTPFPSRRTGADFYVLFAVPPCSSASCPIDHPHRPLEL